MSKKPPTGWIAVQTEIPGLGHRTVHMEEFVGDVIHDLAGEQAITEGEILSMVSGGWHDDPEAGVVTATNLVLAAVNRIWVRADRHGLQILPGGEQ